MTKNYLVLWKDIRLFLGRNDRPVTGHKHPVIQLVVAQKGQFKSKNSATGEWIPKKGLLISPNQPHECDATGVPIISLDIKPDSALGAWILTHIMGEKSVLDYPDTQFEKLDFALIERLVKVEKWDLLYDLFKKTFRFEEASEPEVRDERVDDVLTFIHTHINETLSTEQLTEVSFLSESRLLHLFKEQMGLPIRNYILWYRLKVAIEQVIHGASLTEAAHKAGFSDQSHFTRSCINMIGVPPSSIVKNSKFIQVSFSS